MKRDLTVLIPTYNRRERLKIMLDSICKQGHYGEYIIQIVDNCSPEYDWKDILSDYPQAFVDGISVERRLYNCGMTCNITSSFLFVKTKWVLFLSDDDEMTANSLSIVLKDKERYAEYGVVKYTLDGYPQHPDKDICAINDYCQYFGSYKRPGDILYMGLLFNLEKLKEYMTLGTAYAYNYIGWIMPVIGALIDKKAPMRLSSERIIKYKNPDKGKTFNYVSFVLGISTFMDAQQIGNFKIRKDLQKVFGRAFPLVGVTKSIILNTKEIGFAKYCYKKAYLGLFRPMSLKKGVYFALLFYVFFFLKCIGVDINKISLRKK